MVLCTLDMCYDAEDHMIIIITEAAVRALLAANIDIS